jgi:hypothetical protein
MFKMSWYPSVNPITVQNRIAQERAFHPEYNPPTDTDLTTGDLYLLDDLYTRIDQITVEKISVTSRLCSAKMVWIDHHDDPSIHIPAHQLDRFIDKKFAIPLREVVKQHVDRIVDLDEVAKKVAPETTDLSPFLSPGIYSNLQAKVHEIATLHFKRQEKS